MLLISWTLLFCAIVALPTVPVIGPVAVICMIFMRWYWTILAKPIQRKSLSTHACHLFLGPLAVGGSLLVSTVLPKILKVWGYDVPILQANDAEWMAIALSLSALIVAFYTQVHDFLNRLFGIQKQLIPDDWRDIVMSDDALNLPDLFLNSSSSVFMLFALIYVSMSFFGHVYAMAVMRTERKRAKAQALREAVEAERLAAEVAQEQERIKAGGIPRMANGKSSAFEF